MAAKLLIPVLLGAMCMLSVVKARDVNFQDSQAISMPQASDDDKMLALVIQWAESYCCPKTQKTCCLSKFVCRDFVLHNLVTYDDGKLQKNCNGPLFDVHALSEEVIKYSDLWFASFNCSYSNEKYWKLLWESFGRCSGLSQKKWFDVAIELFQPDFDVALNAAGVIPGGRYSVEKIKKALKQAVGGDVVLSCNDNSATGERQLYEVYICTSKNEKKVIDCTSKNIAPFDEQYGCRGEIVLPNKACRPSNPHSWAFDF